MVDNECFQIGLDIKNIETRFMNARIGLQELPWQGLNSTMRTIRLITTNIRVLNLNAQCLRNKLNTFNINVNEICPEIVCITEHWFSDKESMIFPNIMVNNYTIANYFCRTKHKNGGSLILVKDSLHYKGIEYLGKYKEEITSEISKRLNDIRRQAYDNGTNMKGDKSGAHPRTKALNPQPFYILPFIKLGR
ncbi:hypothetical protein WA026_002710 [Henosepilachna vigintioctopunctata]|uniref:Uncharacterized protein n=1 Tax=Henosepilachna vigintioctopunctata TaxID=420089 RepID=A0AAW1TVK1_9CUCU